jgi:hypothetical protein
VILVAGAAAVVRVVGRTADSSSRSEQTRPAQRPTLAPYAQNPLAVKGSGFRPHERVRVSVKGVATPETLSLRASSKGTFSVAFRHVNGCDSITVTASGSKGSRASFNLSQIVCIEP